MNCLNTSVILSRIRPLSIMAFLMLLGSMFIGQNAWGQSATVVTSYDATGTWLCPAGVTSITVECWGGGGRGGTATTNGSRCGGGGGGAYASSVVSVTPGNTYTVTVGAGSVGVGVPGGDSWFNTAGTVMAKGGNTAANNSTTGATGGAAGSSIGTVTFSGGNGANAPATTGGGGGSSAGTAAAGNDATTIAGAAAPAGGGNGGGGGSVGGFGADPGDTGAEPGGGGGGAERATTFNGAGGNGANGKVTITWNSYTNGACLAANQSPIYDFACTHAPTTLTFAVSGLPTTLGTAPGNVLLDNVALIIAHTWNNDLDITLTSPGGTTRNLMLDRFGNGDNIGVPGTCPASPLILKDGGLALSNANTSNVVGTYAPEQTLGGFTGNPNGNWTLTICDDADADFGNLRMARLKFCTLANAGTDQSICSNAAATLAANAPPTGAGAWSVVSGPSLLNSQFSNIASPTATFTPAGGAGTYTLRWTITDSPCAVNTDDMVLTVVAAPTTATVGGPQTICALGTTGGLGGNSAGTWSIVSGGTGNFNPNNTTPNATFTHTGEAGPVVVRWTITGTSPCPNSTADVTITITQPSVASDAGPDQPLVCSQPGTATMAANAATNGGVGNWTQVSGPAATITTPGSPTTTITGMNTLGAYVFRWTITNAPCASTQDDVTLTVGACVYYSQLDGNVSDPIWSDVPVGTPGPATFTSSSSMVVQSTHEVTNTGSTIVDDLTVDGGGELRLNGGTSFTASGDAVAITGALTALDNSLLVLNSPVASTLTLTGTRSVYALSVDVDVSCTMTGGLEVRGSLDLVDGNFDASGATVTLRSFSTGTGRLGPVGATASYTGNMIVQRRIPGGVTNWRLLGSPVSGLTVAAWHDDFITAGYPGSDYPNFDDPVGSGILWPSIRHYVETNTGPLINDGLVGVTSAMALSAGKGFAAWCGDMLGGTAPFMTDLTGPPNIALTPITLPMTFTSTGDLAVDGWNLVSNPVPSPLAFDQISRGANVEDYVSYYDPITGNVATWDISLGSGTNGGTNTIQSGQGFWLKANGATVTTSVSETDKTTGNGGGFFGGDEESVHELVRLKVTSGMNTFSDETVVVFSAGSAAVESEDVRKMIFNHPAAPQIGTFGSPTELLAINAHGAYSTAISIPVMVDAGVSGTYTVTATGLVNMGLRCLSLEDLITGAITPLTEGASYSFEMDAATDPAAPRLLLHATVPMPFDVLDATCAGMANGQATVVITEGPADVTWTDEFGAVLSQQTGVMEGDVTFGGLAAGSYMVHVTSNTACGELVSEFTIDAPFVLEGTTVSNSATSCADTEDGSIDVMIMGGVEPYTYAWSNGADTEDLVASAGDYTLTVTDANNCEWVSDVFTIDAGGAIAGFTVVDPVVLVNAGVIFTNTSVSGETFFWEFGDGATSTEVEPVHAYSMPGTYTVTLTVTSGDCSDATSFDVTVELNTGMSTSTAVGVSAWVSSNGFVVEHGFTSGTVFIEVLDATGSLHATRNAGASPGRVILPHEGLSTGVWFVRVTNGGAQQTFRLPLLR